MDFFNIYICLEQVSVFVQFSLTLKVDTGEGVKCSQV